MHELLHTVATVSMALIVIWCFFKIRKLKNEKAELSDRLELKKIFLHEAICTSNTWFKRCRELFKENKELKSQLSKKPL